MVYSRFSLAVCFTRGSRYIYISVTFSIFPLSSKEQIRTGANQGMKGTKEKGGGAAKKQ